MSDHNQLLRSSQRNGGSARTDGQAAAGTERIVGRDGVIARELECLVGNVEVQMLSSICSSSILVMA